MRMRFIFGLVSLFALLFLPLEAGARGEKCFPKCRRGYICHKGACVSACNPRCARDERCTPEGECVARKRSTSKEEDEEAPRKRKRRKRGRRTRFGIGTQIGIDGGHDGALWLAGQLVVLIPMSRAWDLRLGAFGGTTSRSSEFTYLMGRDADGRLDYNDNYHDFVTRLFGASAHVGYRFSRMISVRVGGLGATGGTSVDSGYCEAYEASGGAFGASGALAFRARSWEFALQVDGIFDAPSAHCQSPTWDFSDDTYRTDHEWIDEGSDLVLITAHGVYYF